MLHDYELASGQKVNYSKSTIAFSKNVPSRLNKKLEGWQNKLLSGYLQAYIYDTEHELENRLSESEGLDMGLVEKMQ